MRIVFYGRLAQSIGPEIDVENCVGRSVAELRASLAREHPDAASTLASSRSRACVGNSLVDDSYVIEAADHVEFLPPVSGG